MIIFIYLMRLFDEFIFYLLQAAQQQKFREIQEVERRKRFEEQRARDHDKFIQVEERRRVSFYSFLLLFHLILIFIYVLIYKH
jgi:type IV secretory pathway component VirB8